MLSVDGAVGLPKYDRDKEEMEILKRYIRSEDAHIEVRECSCVQTNIDFNRQFHFDSKVFLPYLYPSTYPELLLINDKFSEEI